MDGLLIARYPTDDQELSAYTAEISSILASTQRFDGASFSSGPIPTPYDKCRALNKLRPDYQRGAFLIVIMLPLGDAQEAHAHCEKALPDLLAIVE